MSMNRELSFFLGLQVKQTDRGIFIHQSRYALDLLRKYKMDKCSSSKLPMSPTNKPFADPTGEPFDQWTYRGLIGSLLYLTASRLDITLATGLCARFQASPKVSHYEAVKKILRYIKGTSHLGLWYPSGMNFNLQAFSDADHAGCKLDRKSTSGSCHFLGGRLISWSSKKQNCVALSTAEAEYIAAANCCAQVLWMKTQLLDYG